MDIERLLFFKELNVTQKIDNRSRKKAQKRFLALLGYHERLRGFLVGSELLSAESLAQRIYENGLVRDYSEAQNEVIKLVESSNQLLKVDCNKEPIVLQYHFEEFSNCIGVKRYKIQENP